MIDSSLVELLACPACESRPPVTVDIQNQYLECTECHRRYPIREGIPIMLEEEAEQPPEATNPMTAEFGWIS